MAKAARRLATLVATGAILAAPLKAAGQDGALHRLRVRSHSPDIVRLIEQVSERSTTFRKLIDIINASNGIVYVEEGRCSFAVRACLVAVTPAVGYRILNVRIDTAKSG